GLAGLRSVHVAFLSIEGMPRAGAVAAAAGPISFRTRLPRRGNQSPPCVSPASSRTRPGLSSASLARPTVLFGSAGLVVKEPQPTLTVYTQTSATSSECGRFFLRNLGLT